MLQTCLDFMAIPYVHELSVQIVDCFQELAFGLVINCNEALATS